MNAPRILVLGWIGSPNLGDELITEQTCRLLREAGCEPTLVTIDPEASAHFGTPLVRHAGARDALPLALAMRRHDGAVFGGGGLIQDETGPLNIAFHLSRLATARMLRRPWIGLGLGIGAVDRRTGRLLVRAVLRGAEAITVRDSASAERHRRLTGRPAVVGADPVFLSHPDPIVPSDHLVVSLRRANEAGQRRLATSTPPSPSVVAHWADLIDALAAAHGLGVRFVAWERDQDAALHDAVARELSAPSEREVPGVADVVERMGSGRLVLTMRYHGAVAALLHRRPAVVLDYSPKMGDLVAESNGGAALLSLNATAAHGVEAMASIIDNDDARSEALAVLRSKAAVHRDAVASLATAARHRGR